MSRSFHKNFSKWNWHWPNPHVGRYWKRCLSKARRRQAKYELLGIKYKTSIRYENECSWKTW